MRLIRAAGLALASLVASVIPAFAAAQNISSIAGAGVLGDSGPATSATLRLAIDVAFDADGNMYLADFNNFAIRKVDTEGTISTIAGTGAPGYSDGGGVALSAQMSHPHSVAVDAAGNVYFADHDNCRIRKVTPAGAISNFAGTGTCASGSDGGQANETALNNPYGITLDAAGNMYVGERSGNKVRKISTAGIVSTVAGNGSRGYSGDGGDALLAMLNDPSDVEVDASGNVYVADSNNHLIRKITAATGVITSVAGTGTLGAGADDVAATSSALNFPYGVALSPAGVLYISDYSSRIRYIDGSGIIHTAAGRPGAPYFSGDGGPATSADIWAGEGLEFSPAGDLYFADAGNSRIRKVDSAGIITTVAGIGTFSGDGGQALDALIRAPKGIALDSSGNLYFGDTGNRRVRKITPAGVISTVAGNGGLGSGGDGGPATSASLDEPSGVAVDPSGNLYITERFSRRIRKVTPGGTITTYAGTGLGGYNGDGIPATTANLGAPIDVVFNTFNNTLYYVDRNMQRVRTINSAGTINTFAGNGTAGFAGDGGPATSAQLFNPQGIAIDASGNVYIADSGNQRIRKVTPAGVISTIAGTGVSGWTGDGGPATAATLAAPRRLALDAGGNLYIIEASRVRKVSTSGIISTVAGNAASGFIGDGGPASASTFWIPEGLTVDAGGNILVADNTNDRIRRISNELKVADMSVAEGASGTAILSYTATLSQVSRLPVTFDMATANGTATAGTDYVAKTLAGITIPAGQTSKQFGVTIRGDLTVEPDETFVVNLSGATGADLTDTQVTTTILNDDGPSLSIGDVSVYETDSGTPYVAFPVTLSAPSASPVTVTLTLNDGTATFNTDYSQRSNSYVTIPAGVTSYDFEVNIHGDTEVEADETFTVTASNMVGGVILDGQATGTILNNDAGGGPTLSIGDVTISEGDSLTKIATFTVTLSAPQATGVYFDAATANGTATAGSDFVGKSTAAIKIPAGATSQTFRVTINGDTTVESDETFTVNLSNPVGVVISDAQAIGTITNDDVVALPTLSIEDVSISEGNSSTKLATFTVTLSAPQSTGVYFDAATANGTATAGSDFVGKSTAAIKIPAGSTSQTFRVTINGDTNAEADETFTVNLSNPVGATIADGQAVGTITNDDSGALPTLSIGDVSISEGNSLTKLMTFTVTLSAPQATGVYFDAATANGTATAGSDFVGKSTPAIKIPAGVTSQTFRVTINGDTNVEPDETFTVNLSNPVGATIADGEGVGTIANDDAATVVAARFNAGSLVDDIDDGNRALQLSSGDYALLLSDTAQRLCARTGAATLIGVDGVENRAVLADLADAANLTCAGKPRYQAVMAEHARTGFLVQAPSDTDARGVKVVAAPRFDARSGLSELTVQASGHARPLTLLLPRALPTESRARKSLLQALGNRVAATVRADAEAQVVLMGAVTVKPMIDLSTREMTRLKLKSPPAERILISPALQREFNGSTLEYLPASDKAEAAQILHLQQ